MHLLLLLDNTRTPATTQAIKLLCQRLRWQEVLQPMFVLGAERATTLSYTQEWPELFYNAEEFISLADSHPFAAQNVQSVSYIHQGYTWQRLACQRWRLIHHPHAQLLGPRTISAVTQQYGLAGCLRLNP